MKIALFLGSGASVPFGKPVTKTFRNNLITKFKSNDTYPYRFLNTMLNYSNYEDIEHVLQGIREIRQFYDTSKYGVPYLNSLSCEMRMPDGIKFPLAYLIDNLQAIQGIVESEVFNYYSWNHDFDENLRIFDQYTSLIEEGSTTLDIFTTNYDRAIEEYCSRNEIQCNDGFEPNSFKRRTLWTGNFDLPVHKEKFAINLFKLHGSLNWKRHKIYGIESTSAEGRSVDHNYIENLLIYPYLSPKDGMMLEPYVTIRNQFIKRTSSSDVLIVIGFSCRDRHINDVLKDLIDQGKILIFISPTVNKDLEDNLFENEMFDTTTMELSDG
ncbi:MAG TPA: SIR2 family protein [Candidatus Nitrosocosmicus sp.]|nr:SIR2 family protein [Candidatus Nitrosocosmicus sp.]